MKMTSFVLSLAGAFALCAQASAQNNFNVDIDGTYGTPTSALAAAGMAGTWNLVPATGATTPLVNTAGVAGPVTIGNAAGGFAFSFNNAGTLGDDEALMDDLQDVGGVGATATWVINGLPAGTYNVRTYAWAPDSATFITSVSVNGSSPQLAGGGWPSGYIAGVTHTLDTVTISAGGTISILLATSSGFGSFNGVQVEQAGPPPSPFTSFCSGDGTGTACPCANNGIPGNGCAHSVSANGANLAATGTASIAASNAQLNGTNMPNSTVLYFQGTLQIAAGAGAAFGDGKRCAGGVVIRLSTKTNVAGASSYPVGADLPLHVKGAVVAGDTRSYQAWFRNADPTFCTPSTFNLSNGLTTTWVP